MIQKKKEIRSRLLILTCFVSLGGLGSEDIANKDIDLSDKLRRGSALIYDCKDKHTACTDRRSMKFCNEFNRKKGSCFLIKEFKSEKECQEFQQKLVSSSYYGMQCDSK